MGNEEFVKVYESKLEGPHRRKDHLQDGRIGWRSTWERGINGRGGLEQARRECWDREKWRLFCPGRPLWGCSWGREALRATDR